jgi:hypothetical protein
LAGLQPYLSILIATAGAAFALLLDAASFAVMSVICLKLPRPGTAGTPAAPSGRRAAAPGSQLGLMLRSPAFPSGCGSPR